jgi:hypothetical protein
LYYSGEHEGRHAPLSFREVEVSSGDVLFDEDMGPHSYESIPTTDTFFFVDDVEGYLAEHGGTGGGGGVSDTTAPVITILSTNGTMPEYDGDFFDPTLYEFPEFTFSAFDDRDGDISHNVSVENGIFNDGSEAYSYVTFTVTDSAGNTTVHTEKGNLSPVGFDVSGTP